MKVNGKNYIKLSYILWKNKQSLKRPTSFGLHPIFLPLKFTVESSQPYGCILVLYYYDFVSTTL